jgi:hypothetical protein
MNFTAFSRQNVLDRHSDLEPLLSQQTYTKRKELIHCVHSILLLASTVGVCYLYYIQSTKSRLQGTRLLCAGFL